MEKKANEQFIERVALTLIKSTEIISEVKKVANYLKQEESGPNYKEEITNPSPEETEGLGETKPDELLSEAEEVVKESGRASASLLQRRMRVGYARAARLLDLMEEKGLIGPANGAKARKVFIQEEKDEE